MNKIIISIVILMGIALAPDSKAYANQFVYDSEGNLIATISEPTTRYHERCY